MTSEKTERRRANRPRRILLKKEKKKMKLKKKMSREIRYTKMSSCSTLNVLISKCKFSFVLYEVLMALIRIILNINDFLFN